MYKKTVKSSAIYHIKDDIKHFQFNVSFRHITSLLNLPKFDVKSGKSAVVEDGKSPDNEKDVWKIVTIKWQEKLFSAQEIEFFRDISNCLTDTQKSYHRLIIQDEQNSITLPSDPIFTFVHEDNYSPEQERTPTEKPPARDTNSQDVLMHVYAAVNKNTVLVSLRWQPSQKLLHIYPDFNSFRENPYFIEIDTDYRHLYAYGIENSSMQCRKSRKASPFAELKLPDIPHWEGIDELSTKFTMPPKRTRRMAILLEIQKAEEFEYDGIHVRYHIRLPERTILEEGILTGCTHTSQANGDGVCGFGHCLEIVLLCEEDFKEESLCYVYFEVVSIDSWERERVEGYSYCSFVLEKGFEGKVLQCHRPIEGGVLEKLNRYFIGGRRRFDFEKFYGGNGDFCNRYGTTMITTGTLAVRCQRMSQRNPELLKPAPGRMVGMTLEDIMKAYREARRRLEAIVV